MQQAAKEAWGGWLGDLVLPLLTDDPGSALPPQSVEPQQLADPDSRFVEVQGLTLHFKEAWPSSSSSHNGSSDSSGGSSRGAADGGFPAGEQQAAARPTVLLVHGLNGSTFNWRATMQPLADATGCRYGAWGRPCLCNLKANSRLLAQDGRQLSLPPVAALRPRPVS